MAEEKYINPFTDFGFKKLFGEEMNKDLLIDFLNVLLEDEQAPIKNLRYMDKELQGRSEIDRRAIFDLYCETTTGTKFIVELQKVKQKFFKDRSVFYSTFPIAQQAQRGDWDFELQPVYMVAILDFIFAEDKAEVDKYRYSVKLTDIESHKIFYEKLTFVYLEMPKFRKTVDELETHFDKWLYLLRNLPKLDRMPDKLKDAIFQKVFNVAELAGFTDVQYKEYQHSRKQYLDLKNSMDTRYEEGEKVGLKKGLKKGEKMGRQKTALNLLRATNDIALTATATGLSKSELARLQELLTLHGERAEAFLS